MRGIMLYYPGKKKLFFFLLILLLNQISFTQPQHEAETFNPENQFFTLDFTSPSVDLNLLRQHFFTTFPHDDPTQGNVVYDQTLWKNKDIIQIKPADGLYLYLRARNDDKGFDSFRLTSKSFFNLSDSTPRLLFVFKGELPSARGIWPAWWLNGSHEAPWLYKEMDGFPTEETLHQFSGKGSVYATSSPVNNTDWPAAGEIDIIELINGENVIHNTLHTCPQMCDAIWNENTSPINCANARNGDPNAGCSGTPYSVKAPKGTFAFIWEKRHMRFYYWPSQAEVRTNGGPLSAHPDPQTWSDKFLKNEVTLLETDVPCDENIHYDWQCRNCKDHTTCDFVNMKMIFNATICGLWAGNKFDQSKNALKNCQKYVLGEGKKQIDGKFLKIEYVSVKPL